VLNEVLGHKVVSNEQISTTAWRRIETVEVWLRAWDKRLGGRHGRSGRRGEHKKSLPCPCRDPNFGRPAHSLDTILSYLGSNNTGWPVQTKIKWQTFLKFFPPNFIMNVDSRGPPTRLKHFHTIHYMYEYCSTAALTQINDTYSPVYSRNLSWIVPVRPCISAPAPRLRDSYTATQQRHCLLFMTTYVICYS
jgi:hypothetical protein